MTNPDNPQFGIQEQESFVELAKGLNKQFRQGASAWDLVADIRAFPRPILVDVESTLVVLNTPGQYQAANLNARKVVQELRSIGNIFFVSNHPDFQTLEEELEANGLLYPDTILMARDNWSPQDNSGNYLPKAEGAIEEYVFSRYGIGAREDFLKPLKRVAPLFRKHFDVPLIDDMVEFTDDNPGILGLRVKPIDRKEEGLDLMEAVEKIRQFYSTKPSIFLYDQTPFNTPLVLSEFDKMSMDALGANYSARLMTPINRPDVIVRVSDKLGQLVERDFKNIKQQLEILETRYGILIPRHEVVVGPAVSPGQKKTYYLVTDRIYGQSLDLKFYNEDEKDQAKAMLNDLYPRIARYLLDTFLEGGLYIDDIAFGNEQYVYGRRKGESEDLIWFSDIGPLLMDVASRSPEPLRKMEKLFEMVAQSERYLGQQLSGARETIVNLLKTISEEDEDYWRMLELRRKIGDKSAGTEEDDKKELAGIMVSYQETVGQIDISAPEWEEIIQDLFEERYQVLKNNLRKVGKGEVELGQVMNISDYNEQERTMFSYFVYLKLVKRLNASIDQETISALDRRYGFFLIGDALKKAISPRQSEIVKKQDADVFMKIKKVANMKMVKDLGWEDEVLSRFDFLCELFENIHYAERNAYLLTLCSKQLGWDYQFPINTGELKKRFKATKGKKTVDNFTDFVVGLVGEHLDQAIGVNLEKVRERYGDDTADTLSWMFQEREVDRILEEARR